MRWTVLASNPVRKNDRIQPVVPRVVRKPFIFITKIEKKKLYMKIKTSL